MFAVSPEDPGPPMHLSGAVKVNVGWHTNMYIEECYLYFLQIQNIYTIYIAYNYILY